MAESVAITSMAARYFCHKCNQEINPVLPEFKCPGCSEGFIEELSSDSNLETSSDDSLGNPEVLDLLMDEPHGRYADILQLLRRLSSSAVDAQQGTSSWDFSLPFIQFLHGNPGDYAWGSQGLDAIMTQLLNSIESNGPPPMPKEEIEKLPIVEISQEDVNKNLQCTVCMEDYKLGEPVKQLQCQHVYHSDCIIPWLEMHGTCPICRKLLSDNEASQRNGSTTTSQGTQPSQQPNSNQRTSNSYHDLLDYD